MTSRIFLIFFLLAPISYAEDVELPQDVDQFIYGRDVCNHFRGEPTEGNSPAQVKRRKFVLNSLDKYCTGTDAKLASLKNKYKNNYQVTKALRKYEEKIESN